MISKGREVVQRAYLYRSVSVALPTLNEHDMTLDDGKLLELYRAQHQVLEPQMRILKDMMHFVAESRQLFKSVIANALEPEKLFSDVMASRLIEIVDLVRLGPLPFAVAVAFLTKMMTAHQV